MPQGYEVQDANGQKAWWDGKKLTPLDERGYQMKRPPPPGGNASVDSNIFRRAQDSVTAIDDATKRTNWFRTGTVGGISAKIPGSPAFNLDKDLDTLKARTAFEELAAMRSAPGNVTGGALGNVTERELAMLQASEANLDVGQGEEQIDRNLGRMRRTVTGRTPGLDPSNPIVLTEANRNNMPDGAYFKAGDGKVYRHTKGAGFGGKAAQSRGGQDSGVIEYDAQGRRVR